MRLCLLLALLPTTVLAQQRTCESEVLGKTVPHLSRKLADEFAAVMVKAAKQGKIGVDWVAARTYVESNFRNVISKRFKNCRTCIWRQSWGLMQLEVHKYCLPKYIGREKLLMHPGTNFRIGAGYLAYWKQWHRQGHCRCGPAWWLHYKYGYIVPKRKRKEPKGGWKMERYRQEFNRLLAACLLRRKKG